MKININRIQLFFYSFIVSSSLSCFPIFSYVEVYPDLIGVVKDLNGSPVYNAEVWIGLANDKEAYFDYKGFKVSVTNINGGYTINSIEKYETIYFAHLDGEYECLFVKYNEITYNVSPLLGQNNEYLKTIDVILEI